jgi:DinB family protein
MNQDPGVGQQLDELRALPAFLQQLLAQFTIMQRKIQPAPGVFSFTEHVCHLRDLEREGYLLRIERMLSEDIPDLPEFDGAKVAAERNYSEEDVETALASFETLRETSLKMLASLSPQQLARKGRIGTFGIIGLEELIHRMVEHDRSHAQELNELKQMIHINADPHTEKRLSG